MADDNTTENLTQQDIKLLEKKLALTIELNKADTAANELLDRRLGKQKEYLLEVERKYEVAKLNLAANEAQIASVESLKKLAESETANAETRAKAQAELNKLLAEMNEASGTSYANAETLLGKLNEQHAKYKEITEETERQATAAQSTGKIIEQQLRTSLGLKDTQGEMSDIFIDNFGDVESITASLEKMAEKMREVVTVKNVAKKMMRDIKAFGADAKAKMFGVDSLLAKYERIDQELTQATGATQKYGDESKKMVGVLRDMNFTMKESSQIYETLFAKSEAFSNITAKGRQALVVQSAQLTRLGVSADTFAESIDGLTKAFGKSPDAVNKTTADLAQFGRALGIGPDRMLKSFNKNLNLMSYYGEKKGVEMLKKLAVTAKSTGVEMDKLVGIASKFDTFESAAESAGQLNMLLGGPLLNSMELMTASEEERIEMLRESVRMSGKQFDQMNKFEKQAIAAAMGTDVDIAQKLFSDDNLSSIKDATAAVQAQADGLNSLGDAADKATTPAQKKAAADEKMLDVMSKMSGAIETLNEIMVGFGGVMNTLSPIIAIVTMVIQAMAFATGTLGTSFMATGLAAAKAWIMILGPIALVMGALYLLYAYWEDIGPMFLSIAESVVDAVKFIVKGIFGVIVGWIGGIMMIIGGAIDLITGAVAGLASLIPGVDIEGTNLRGKAYSMTVDMMPEFAEGVDNRTDSGAAIVGEKGPELRTVPQGSSVITNANLETISSLVEAFKSAVGGGTAQQAAAGGRPEEQTINVTLKLDNDVLAKHSAVVATNVVNTMLEFE